MLDDNKAEYYNKELFSEFNGNNSKYVEELLINKKFELLKKLHKISEKNFKEDVHRTTAEDFLNLKISQLDRLINHFQSRT